MRHTSQLTLLAVTALATAAMTQSLHLVAPATYATTDANRFCALPGAVDPFRHQTLIGASHLSSMAGNYLSAIEFRRSAANEIFAGGQVHLTVNLSITPITPIQCSNAFVNNTGPSPIQVFSDTVDVPLSPATTVPTWTFDNVVRIAFQTPFHYTGGTLCVDIEGAPIAGQTLGWWMADAVYENITGTVHNLGGGCPTSGSPTSDWNTVIPNTLAAGHHAHSIAHGTPGGFALAAIGIGSPSGIPLQGLWPSADPQCIWHIPNPILTEARWFVPHTIPELANSNGRADLEIKLPGIADALGATLTTQWLDWTEKATSNAIEWTISLTMPTLDMALIEGHPQEATGHAASNMAHVLRFEYQ